MSKDTMLVLSSNIEPFQLQKYDLQNKVASSKTSIVSKHCRGGKKL
jgi:hypothetical protein